MSTTPTTPTGQLDWADLTPTEQALISLVRHMPDPIAGTHAAHLEDALSQRFGVAHAVAVSSGTAALHCALLAAGIGPGDEVLIPSLCVPMSAAPILYAGARPVFIDCTPGGIDVDEDDLLSKITPRTRAITAVHLWGRASSPKRLRTIAGDHGLRLIEDACQAHGTRYDDQLLGTFGDIGCLSFKDGKIISGGEGGALLTDDAQLAATARALRSHWQTPPPGNRPDSRPGSRLGYNYRLAEPLALLAGGNLTRFEELMSLRRAQSARLLDALATTAGLRVIDPGPREEWNHYSPLLRVDLPHPRRFSEHLAAAGVPNSVGSFGLIPCHQRPPFTTGLSTQHCPNAEALIDTILAIAVHEKTSDMEISTMAATITREAQRWPGI